MSHVMFDLETFGTRPGSVIRSIGAVVFDPNGSGHGDGFYANINRKSCEDLGLTVDPATEKWWSQQSRDAEWQLEGNQKPLPEVVNAFGAWFVSVGGEYIWCQGANFDSVLWEAAIVAAGRKVAPWKFWNVRDTRTIYHMARFNDKTIKRDGTFHNALDDAKHQVACVQAAMRKIRGNDTTARDEISFLKSAPPRALDLEALLDD